jgi:hypothetical protein
MKDRQINRQTKGHTGRQRGRWRKRGQCERDTETDGATSLIIMTINNLPPSITAFVETIKNATLSITLC